MIRRLVFARETDGAPLTTPVVEFIVNPAGNAGVMPNVFVPVISVTINVAVGVITPPIEATTVCVAGDRAGAALTDDAN